MFELRVLITSTLPRTRRTNYKYYTCVSSQCRYSAVFPRLPSRNVSSCAHINPLLGCLVSFKFQRYPWQCKKEAFAPHIPGTVRIGCTLCGMCLFACCVLNWRNQEQHRFRLRTCAILWNMWSHCSSCRLDTVEAD